MLPAKFSRPPKAVAKHSLRCRGDVVGDLEHRPALVEVAVVLRVVLGSPTTGRALRGLPVPGQVAGGDVVGRVDGQGLAGDRGQRGVVGVREGADRDALAVDARLWTLSTRWRATPWLVASPTWVSGLSAWAMVPVPGRSARARTAESGAKPSRVPCVGVDGLHDEPELLGLLAEAGPVGAAPAA